MPDFRPPQQLVLQDPTRPFLGFASVGGFTDEAKRTAAMFVSFGVNEGFTFGGFKQKPRGGEVRFLKTDTPEVRPAPGWPRRI